MRRRTKAPWLSYCCRHNLEGLVNIVQVALIAIAAEAGVFAILIIEICSTEVLVEE